MLAFTIFFLVELKDVPKQWRRSVCCAALVTGVAFWNYNYMRDAWVYTQQSPTTYRYTDWLITVPLQIVEFYLILSAVMDVSTDLFYRLLISSVVMLMAGWFGETGVCSVLVGFIPGMLGWLYILYEIFVGEASQISAKATSKAATQAFNTLRLIVSVGWTIYPLGYYLVYLGPTYTYHAVSVVNITYNIADFVNKGAFGMAIYSAAMTDDK
jgi:bacteriorhodopsin